MNAKQFSKAVFENAPQNIKNALYTHEQLKEVVSNGSWKKDGTDTKLMWELLPFDALREVVKRFTWGAKHYGANDWKNCANTEYYWGALLRHIDAARSGERMDGDTGMTHLSAVAWNALALVWFDLQEEMQE